METSFDLLVLSHLRWDFVFQRPQHLLSRCARVRRVFFVEEPIIADGGPHLQVSPREGGLTVVTPYLPESSPPWERDQQLENLLDGLLTEAGGRRFVLWYYTPMALAFTRGLQPLATVYDCMDELSLFRGAPAELVRLERELLRRADLVFTGGRSLYEAKRSHHPHVFCLPSSVDRDHFGRARLGRAEPADQAAICRPRLGYFGVIDERMDLDLIDGLAALRPDWQIVMVGPVVKIDPATLPSRSNIHYLGQKRYEELPEYIAGWDVALLPFARNESTRFISPTKTPEYLAAGCPVVSTSIRDVVSPYGEMRLARIADTPEEFAAAAEAAMIERTGAWLQAADSLLAEMSWDKTWAAMNDLIDSVVSHGIAASAGRASVLLPIPSAPQQVAAD